MTCRTIVRVQRGLYLLSRHSKEYEGQSENNEIDVLHQQTI
jgi:hypothetical protein